MNKSAQHAYPRMQLRTASGKSKSTTQKLVMIVNFYQTVNMSSKTMLVYQNNLSIKKMKFIKNVCCSTTYSPETLLKDNNCSTNMFLKGYPLEAMDFELKKVLLPPPPLGNFADISYLEENVKPHL